jgi:hypothetical protein
MPVRKASSSGFYDLTTRKNSHANLHNAIFKEGNERSVAPQIPSKGLSPIFLKKAKEELLAPLSPKLFKWTSSPGKPYRSKTHWKMQWMEFKKS